MTLRALILPAAAALALALAAPAAAQQTPDPPDAPAGTGEDDTDLVRPTDPQAPALYGSETQGYAAEEFYWMNPEADRWPDDLDPRDNTYLPSPEPALTFELDLGL